MNGTETLRAAAETIASHPSIAGATGVTLSGAGIVAILAQASTVLGVISLVTGIVVGWFVIRVHNLKYKLMMREWNQGVKTNEVAE